MDEIKYRESRVCRLLGNPVVYQLVLFLESGGPLRLSKMGKMVGGQGLAVSIYLGKLRAADVVRYDTSGKETRYWLKHKSEMKGLLKMLERLVNVSAKLE